MEHLLKSTEAEHLQWVVDALSGTEVDEATVDVRFADGLKSMFPPKRWVEMMRQQSPPLRPFSVSSVEVGGGRARVELDTPIGSMAVTLVVDHAGRITTLAITPMSGAGLTPRLPAEFEPNASDAGVGQRLVVVAGVPGTGKSTLAERLGVEIGAPVAALDWLLGALTPFGGRGFDHLLDIGEELLTTLAYRQLELGQGIVLDAPAESLATRQRWTSLAAHFGARLVAIVCECSDESIHRHRLESRTRGIPGWHEGGNWDNVSRRRDDFIPWEGDHLRLDATTDLEENVAKSFEWLCRR